MAPGSTHTSSDISNSASLVDYVKSLDCIHCGLCLQTCPTYRLTGQEASSPRGRIHLMRAAAEGRLAADEVFVDEMDFCLLCRHCESVCPAGVEFGSMMEHTRGALEARGRPGLVRRLLRFLGFRLVLPNRLALRLVGTLMRATQILALDRLADRLLGGARFAHLPRIPPLSARRLLPRNTPAQGHTRERVALLQGCVMPEFHARVNRATVRSLTRLGREVEVPEAVCCGSLHAHNGDLEGARRLAYRLIESWEALERDGSKPRFVTNSAGCGAHMKELQHLFPREDPWHARAAALAAATLDYSELVAPLVEGALAAVPSSVPQPIAWDDPCHLCHAQKIRAEPRRVLDAIPGLERVELPDSESCCGSAGIYSLLRPESSNAIFKEKLEALQRSGARTLVSANPGCQVQWESGLARAGSHVRVLHLAELVDCAQSASRQEPG